jgi:hypothetical protein
MVKLSAMGLKILHNIVPFLGGGFFWKLWDEFGVNGGGSQEKFLETGHWIGWDGVVVGDMIYLALLL